MTLLASLSRDHDETLTTLSDALDDVSDGEIRAMSAKDFFQHFRARHERRDAAIAAIGDAAEGLVLPGRGIVDALLITRSTTSPWRITRFTLDGEPLGHHDAASAAAALKMAVSDTDRHRLAGIVERIPCESPRSRRFGP